MSFKTGGLHIIHVNFSVSIDIAITIFHIVFKHICQIFLDLFEDDMSNNP